MQTFESLLIVCGHQRVESGQVFPKLQCIPLNKSDTNSTTQGDVSSGRFLHVGWRPFLGRGGTLALSMRMLTIWSGARTLGSTMRQWHADEMLLRTAMAISCGTCNQTCCLAEACRFLLLDGLWIYGVRVSRAVTICGYRKKTRLRQQPLYMWHMCHAFAEPPVSKAASKFNLTY